MARFVSLALALTVTGILMLAPFLMVRQMTPAAHTVLPLMLLGVAGAFVHGMGFVPRTTAFRIAFSPIVAWPLIVGGALVFVLIR